MSNVIDQETDLCRQFRELADEYQSDLRAARSELLKLKTKLIEIACDLHFENRVPMHRKSEIEELVGMEIGEVQS